MRLLLDQWYEAMKKTSIDPVGIINCSDTSAYMKEAIATRRSHFAAAIKLRIKLLVKYAEAVDPEVVSKTIIILVIGRRNSSPKGC